MNGKQLKNSILQWAIQGKLVEQNPKDEPASKLLERIAAAKNGDCASPECLPERGEDDSSCHSEQSEAASSCHPERSAKGTKSKDLAKKTKKKSVPTSRIYREGSSWFEESKDTQGLPAGRRDITEEIPFEIPESWEWCRLGDIFYHASGKQQSSTSKKAGIPREFITTSNLYWGRFVLDNVKVMNFTEEEIKTCSATKGDLLVCEGGAGYGRSAIWDKDYDICLQNHVHRLRPCVNGVCEYVYYFIYLLKETNQLVAVGTAMPGLSANRLKGLLLPLPPLAEQKRIVEKLEKVLPLVDEYDSAQTELDKLNAALPETLKKSLLQEAIQGKLVPQNPNDEPASKLLERIASSRHSEQSEVAPACHSERSAAKSKNLAKKKKSAPTSRIYREGSSWYEQIGTAEPTDITDQIPFDIPETWAWTRMGNIGSWGAGATPAKGNPEFYNNGVIPWLVTGELNNSIVTETKVKISQKALDKCSLRLCKPGDVLIAMYGATIGKLAIAGIELTTNQACCACTLHYDFNKYLFYFLMASKTDLTKRGEGGAQPNISKEKLVNYLIPLPPLAEQKRIVAKLEQLFKTL